MSEIYMYIIQPPFWNSRSLTPRILRRYSTYQFTRGRNPTSHLLPPLLWCIHRYTRRMCTHINSNPLILFCRREAPQVRRLFQSIQPIVKPHHAHAQTHWLQALLVRPVRKGVPEEGRPQEAQGVSASLHLHTRGDRWRYLQSDGRTPGWD